MMRRLLFGFFFGVLISACASAQDLAIPEVAYPTLPKQGLSAQDFVPPGWKLETQKTGDLDKDGEDDLLLLLCMDDAKNVIKNESLGRNPFDTNPRILAVAFGSGTAKPYRLTLENHMLITRSSDPVLDDVLAETGGIAIEHGTLNIALHLFSSAGSWAMGTTTYRFRHGKRGFEMIGFDRSTVNRGDGSVRDVSINYLTRKIKIGTGTIENDEIKVEWQTLPKKPLLRIEEIGDGLEFEPLP